MKLVGIDTNYFTDGAIGLGAGGLLVYINKVSSNIALGLPAMPMAVGAIGKFIITVLAAPIFEEGIFRGLMPAFLTMLFDKYSFHISNLIQALLFSVYHYTAYGAGFQTAFVGAFLIGLAAGYLTKHTKSLLPAIVMHAVFNGYLYFSQILVIGG